ncbi:MAG: fumarylacetoacetate hydrolase family protein [Candidatus Acidiferrales bacterium]|jgi:2-keto-4-pentenoate hydratase/2-oxohepta-3-ene-1,7-dioic acid hydratase in catechol pathway
MKLCRFQPLEFAIKDVGRSGHEVRAQTFTGIVEDNSVREIRGGLFGAGERTGRKWPVGEVKFLAPSVPSKIVCVGRNYHDHIKELESTVPKEPLIFLKPPSAVLAPEDPIVVPRLSQRVEYEGEIAIVIGRRCFHLREADDVNPYILGYTALNDVTARDLQRADSQWSRAKGFDTFCPFGPVIETNRPSIHEKVESFVNGVPKQSAPIGDMIFSIDTVIRWIAQVMTLEPGDVIATGTPGGVGPLAPGDVVEVKVSDVGTLRNPVVGPQD